MSTPTLLGTRVYLRPLVPADAALLTRWMDDPDISSMLVPHRPHNTRAEAELEQAKARADAEVALGITLRGDRRLIGVVGVTPGLPTPREAGLTLFIGDKAEWGHGYATEAVRLMTAFAFDALGLTRIWLQVYPHNLAALRVYEKCGFRRTGGSADIVEMETLRDESLRVA